MTASFPWYDLPSVQWANDLIWATMYPKASPLNRRTPYQQQWRSPDLVISQACGLDLYLNSAPIEPIFAPIFDLPDCPEGSYFSYLIGRPGKGVAAVNSVTSRSGFTVLLEHTRPSTLILTGSHRASIDAVRDGSADFACIDAVVWHLLLRDAPETLGGIDIVRRTNFVTAPPYVVRIHANTDAGVRLCVAMMDPQLQNARFALLLRGVMPVEQSSYQDVFDEFERVKPRIPPIGMLTTAARSAVSDLQ